MSYSLLSRTGILENLHKGIVIDPFIDELLNNCSYDVRVGSSFYRSLSPRETGDMNLNPYDQESINRHFGKPQLAIKAGSLPGYDRNKEAWIGVSPDTCVITFEPQEKILAHTIEYIGAAKDVDSERCFNAEMKARSSVGRLGFEVCRCAGWGDIGYVNRWTMEVVCTSEIPMHLVVGTPIAQMKFYETQPIDDVYVYGNKEVSNRDSYQQATDLEELKRNWRPEMMLPKRLKVISSAA